MNHLTAERPALRALVLGAALTAVTTTCITVTPLSADELTVTTPSRRPYRRHDGQPPS
jgi:hypothetical protein